MAHIIKDYKGYQPDSPSTAATSELSECWVVLDDAGDVQWVQLHMEEEERKKLEEDGFYVDKHKLIHR